MKTVFLIAFFGLAFIGVNAQSTAVTSSYVQGVKQVWYYMQQLDTISTSSSTFSQAIATSPLLWTNMDCSVSIVADSLSGGPAASIIIQERDFTSGSNWHNIDTITVDGVQTKGTHKWQLISPYFRVLQSAGSSTQSVKVQAECYCKARN